MIRKLFLCLSILFVAASAAQAGVALEMETRELQGGGNGPVDRIYADGEMVRVETGDRGGPTVIFRDNALIILNDKGKTFSRLDEEQAKALGAQMSAMMQQMQAQLKNLPAEQRAMAEKMMKDRMPAQGESPEIKVEKGGRETIDGYDCQKYTLSQDGAKTAEVYAADVPEAGEGMAAFHAMARFATSVLESFQGSQFSILGNHPLRVMEDVEGFPVLTREFQDGQVVREVRLKSVEKKELDAKLFAPPDGYEEADLMSMGR
jgi:hypothetical protein